MARLPAPDSRRARGAITLILVAALGSGCGSTNAATSPADSSFESAPGDTGLIEAPSPTDGSVPSDDAPLVDGDDAAAETSTALDARDGDSFAEATSDTADAPPSTPTVIAVRDGLCTLDHWCWSNPLPFGNLPLHLWVGSASAAWAVAEPNHVLRWDGSGWKSYEFPMPLSGVRGSSPTDVWLVGANGAAVHWDGTQYVQYPTGTTAALAGVFVRATDDAWAVGSSGTILHWNGTAWSNVPSSSTATLLDVWALSASDVWVSGDGTRLHGDGATFSAVSDAYGGSGTEYAALYASSPTDIWTCGTAGAVLHDDGHSWSLSRAGTYSSDFCNSLWRQPGASLWSAGLTKVQRWDGTSWSTNRVDGNWYTGIGGSSDADLWLTGEYALDHWDGSAWTRWTTGPTVYVSAMHGTGANDIWAVGRGAMHFDGAHWSSSPIALTEAWAGVYAAASNDVWAVGRDTGLFAHWDGVSWKTSASGVVQLFAISGTSSSDIWVAGNPAVLHWDGSTWTTTTLSNPASSIHARAKDDVWLLGETVPTGGSFIQHWNGTSWATMTRPSYLQVIWAIAADDVWAGGLAGVIEHYDGKAWTTVASGGVADVQAIHGFASNDVWFTTTYGHVIHWNGSTLVHEQSGTARQLAAVWGTSALDLYAGGAFGGIVHRGP